MKKNDKNISVKTLILSLALFIFASSSFSDVGYVGEDDKIELDVNRIYTQAAKFPRKALRLAKDGYVLIEFDIDTDGNLSNRRIWAYMMPNLFYYYTKTMRFLKITPKEGKGIPYPVPDGICLDEKMGIWIASPTTSEVVRYTEGGKITDRIATPNRAYACMLGGSNGNTLFVCTADASEPDAAKAIKSGKIYSISVNHAKAGSP